MLPCHGDNNFDNCHIDDNILENTHLGGLNAMTICIGALCDNGESAVLIADKMVTFTNISNYKKDDALTKIYKYSDNCYVMSSGNVNFIPEIYSVAHQNTNSLEDHHKVAQAYKTVALESAVEKVLKPRGFNNYTVFSQSGMSDILLAKLDKEVREHSIGLSLITVFYDLKAKRYFLGLVENDKVYQNPTIRGFCSIGVQFHIVEFCILQKHFSITMDIETTKQLLIEVKNDVQPHFDGIGKTHDIVCLNKGKVVESTLV